MKSYSQCSQDFFVLSVLANQRDGSFLEIGTNNPVEINNTYLLENEFNWRGLMVDNSMDSMLAAEKLRKSAFLLTDAAKPQDWIAALRQAEEINHGVSLHPPRYCDYCSLDVDQATLACLSNLPLADLRFRVMTVEHDEYARPGTRDAMLDILRHHKYDILCSDVRNEGLSFEIWCVAPELVDMKLAERFRRTQPTEWREFFV